MKKWAAKTDLPTCRLLRWLGLRENKFYEWTSRFEQPNRHNGQMPRAHWISDEEEQQVLQFQELHPEEGYRVLTYMMMDAGVVAVSPSTTYRILSRHQRLSVQDREPSRKGLGFEQPSKPHEHWHIDISYLNILGTFYYLCTILDGFSRFIVHWEVREQMTSQDVEIIVQRAIESAERPPERIISDNGPQFIARDFKDFLRLKGMKQVRTSPYYPQSNGKLERVNQTIKSESIRRTVILSIHDAIKCLTDFVAHYNFKRLHSGIQYVAPIHMLLGTAQQVWDHRDLMLKEARSKRVQRRRPRPSPS